MSGLPFEKPRRHEDPLENKRQLPCVQTFERLAGWELFGEKRGLCTKASDENAEHLNSAIFLNQTGKVTGMVPVLSQVRVGDNEDKVIARRLRGDVGKCTIHGF